ILGPAPCFTEAVFPCPLGRLPGGPKDPAPGCCQIPCNLPPCSVNLRDGPPVYNRTGKKSESRPGRTALSAPGPSTRSGPAEENAGRRPAPESPPEKKSWPETALQS